MFATPAEGFFDNVVARVADGWLMILARGSNLQDMRDFPAQGLWTLAREEAQRAATNWTEPVRVLDTELPGTAAWMARGVYGPGILAGDGGPPVVFATGVRDSRAGPCSMSSGSSAGAGPWCRLRSTW